MKRTSKIFLFIFFITIAFGCSSTTTNASSDLARIKESKFYATYPNFNSMDLSIKLREEVQKDRLLSPLYSSTNYNLIWAKDTLNTQKLGELITILADVEKHGLPKEVFPTERIITIAKAIEAGQYASDLHVLYSRMVELEKLASSSAIRYVVGMRFGFLNPKTLYGKSHAITIDRATDEYYGILYTDLSGNAIKTMIDSQPNEEPYRLLLSEYEKLDTLKDASFAKIASNGKNMYKLMNRGANIGKISKRLALTGEYKLPDSLSINSEGRILDSDVLEAVNEFRRNNSLIEENEIGEATIQALNRPMDYYQTKIKANLERYRWRRNKEKHSKHIEVNIASQLLLATENGHEALEMRVAVGSLKNKTPLLQSDIAYINLNPVWNVPRSIATKELSVKQKNNPSFFKSNRMKVYKGGKEVDIESVDWNSVDSQNFGYSIKQIPGDHNALGKMKFMFNNNFAVYLHDTPSKAVFNRKNRAVSHGCIRLHKPIDLALFLANPAKDELYTDRLYHTIDLKAPSDEGKKLQAEKKLPKLNDIIRMNESISLFIDYFTVYFKPQDRSTYYAEDVYNYDKPILDGLANLVSITSQPQQTILIKNKKGG